MALGACGGDDSSEVAELTITISDAGDGLAYELDAEEIGSGATEITLVNDSEGDVDGQLIYSSEEHSDEEVLEQLGNAFEGKAVEDWFEGGGGPASAPAGESSTVTQELRAGTYYVVAGEDLPDEVASFTVTDEDGADLPEADGSVEAVDYSFSGEGLTAGESTVLLENNGEQWHHFIAAKMVDGATVEDVEEFFRTEEGEPPLEGGPNSPNPVESTVLEGGTSQLVDVDLEEGSYAFLCFISDKEGGKSHVELGMISEIEVPAE